MTDHKAEAEKVNDYYTDRDLDNAQVIALGQMNATLYLAEQQRIANLIALTALDHVDTGLYTITSDDQPFASYTTALNADIREALGIA